MLLHPSRNYEDLGMGSGLGGDERPKALTIKEELSTEPGKFTGPQHCHNKTRLIDQMAQLHENNAAAIVL